MTHLEIVKDILNLPDTECFHCLEDELDYDYEEDNITKVFYYVSFFTIVAKHNAVSRNWDDIERKFEQQGVIDCFDLEYTDYHDVHSRIRRFETDGASGSELVDLTIVWNPHIAYDPKMKYDLYQKINWKREGF